METEDQQGNKTVPEVLELGYLPFFQRLFPGSLTF